ncbi:MAG: D-cysteine desulfhydrase family protein [Armatimonadota bacterium]|nr:D-cysteine desulfhydrase family protein [Armatimonadota bacterium]MDR7479724.1 D-cysteine desulfhydrase family protein [Armatimonadota bacterium]MDR7489125.1 D-cysteine desulfhydrase family protein [Armatimonadota bacterium]MDR7501739.1 D-cysteine desulfhydrase family protein [Armatimonadota bacterium]MDR7527398.1 D-cysteine desulfhydrase family protein [Armatimonadota bacterium]
MGVGADLRARLSSLPRLGLLPGPTLLEPLPRLSAELGREVWIKREDLTPIGLGGNKVRKLDLILGEDRRADLVITRGGLQSNHCRLTAAVAARLGIACALVLTGSRPQDLRGNLLLSHLFGARVHYLGEAPDAEADEAMEALARAHREHGGRPAVVPLGGANPLGVLAYLECALELADQCAERGLRPSAVIVAVGTGSTCAGLALGVAAALPDCQVVGISVSRSRERLLREIPTLAAAGWARLGEETPVQAAVQVYDDYIGPGYARPSDAGLDAIRRLARLDGLLVDSTYTGKALAGLVDLCRRRALPSAGPVVFVHTGGVPELFALDPSALLGRM